MKNFLKELFYKQRVKKVADFYNDWSARFMTVTDTFQGFRTENIDDTHRYIIETVPLTDGDVILDAGCGVGGPGFYFAQHLNAQVHSVTNAAEQVRIINERKSRDKVTNLTAYHGDYHDLSKIFKPAFFSKVLFLESFGHSYNPKKVLKEVSIVLKPGGTLYMKDIYARKPAPGEDLKKISDLLSKSNDVFVYNHNTAEASCELLKEAGFIVEHCRIPPLAHKSIDDQFEEKLGFISPRGDVMYVEPMEIKARKP